MSKNKIDKNFIINNIDKKLLDYKSDKILDIEKIEKLYKKTITYFKNLSNKKRNLIFEEIHKLNIDKVKCKILDNLFILFNKPKQINSNNLSNKFKRLEPKMDGKYKCFGDYKVINQLGAGAFGSVYLVEKGNKKYAIKNQFIKDTMWTSRTENIKQIKNEIEISIKMGKKNIGPKIYDYYMCDVDFDKTTVIIVMEYMNEGTLSNWLVNNKLTKKHKEQINDKIEKMHNENILHLDIHDENIFVSKKGSKIEFFIGDFGLSQTFKQLINTQEKYDKSCIKGIFDNNLYLHMYISKLFVFCQLI